MAKKKQPASPPPKGRPGPESDARPSVAPPIAPAAAPAAVAPSAAPPTGSAPAVRAVGHEMDGFDDIDDTFFGSETGSFARDEFDEVYDPFDPKTGAPKGAIADKSKAPSKGEPARSPAAPAPAADKTRLAIQTPGAGATRSGPHPAATTKAPSAPAIPAVAAAAPSAPAAKSAEIAAQPSMPTAPAIPAPVVPTVAAIAEATAPPTAPPPAPPPAAAALVAETPAPASPMSPSASALEIPTASFGLDAEEDAAEPPPQVTSPQMAAIQLPEDAGPPAPASLSDVPLHERRAAGALAAQSMSEHADEFDGADEEEDEGPSTDPFGRIPSPRNAVLGEPVSRRSAATPGPASLVSAAPVDVPPAGEGAPAVGGAASYVAELSAEVDASESSPAAARAALLVELGRALASHSGDWAQAEAKFDAASRMDGGSVPALRELVRVAAGRQDWARVVDLLARIESQSTDPAARTAALLGSAHIQLTYLDRLPEAAADLRRALDVLPDNYVALRFLREIHYRTQDWPALVEVLQQARQHCGDSERLRVLYELARLYDEVLKAPAQALATFRECLSLDPRFAPALLACERLLQERNDWAGLAALWTECGDSWGGIDGAFFHLRAARAQERAGGPVAPSLLAAAALDDGSLAAERQISLESEGGTDVLARLAAELDATGAPNGARASAHLAVARSALHSDGDSERSLDHLQLASRLDPQHGEVQEGLRLQLGAAQRWGDLIHHLRSCAEGAEPRVRVAFLLKVAELSEQRLEDIVAARAALESACALAPNYLPAVDALVHVLARQGDFASRAERLELASALVDSAEARACYLLRASRDWERAGQRNRALQSLEKAISEGPGTLLAREWLVEGLIEERRWSAAAGVLRDAAAETADPALKVSLLYRSARLALHPSGDEEAAEAALRSLLDLVPDFLPAALDLRDLLTSRGDWLGVAALLQSEAEDRPAGSARASWHRLAAVAFERSGRAADALTQHLAALSADPTDGASAAAVRRSARAAGDVHASVDHFRRQIAAAAPQQRDLLRAQLAVTLAEARDAQGLAALTAEFTAATTAPLAALAVANESLGRFDEATLLYQAAAEGQSGAALAASSFQVALLAEEVREDSAGAAVAYERARAAHAASPMVLEGLERVYAATGRTAELAALYDAEADAATAGPVRTFYSLLAGEQFENLAEWTRAQGAYERAFADAVGRERAADAMRRVAIARKDLGAYAACVETLAAEGASPEAASRWMDLAELAFANGDTSTAGRALGRVLALAPDFVPALLEQERLCRQHSDWNGLLTVCRSLRQAAASPVLRNRAEATSREVLETHGVTSEAAFDFYRSLHEREPENLVALKGLAGIARGKKEWDDARLYFDECLRLAKEPGLKADLCVELASISVEADQDDKAAVRHYEQALEAVPHHKAAVAGLKEAHARSNNWSGLVGVLARQASTLQGEARTQLFAEIARVWDERIGNLKVALSSWQKVLQDDPRHAEAGERVLALYARLEDWNGWLDAADRSLSRLTGLALRDRQAEMGLVALDRLSQGERASNWLRAACAHEPPSLPALEALRKIARTRGDWEQFVQLADRQAEVVTSDAERAALLEEAARVKLDQVLDREGAASLFERLIRIAPDNAAALQFFVGYYVDREDWAAALPVFERYESTVDAMDTEDDDARIEITAYHYKFGVVLGHNGEAARALARFERALVLSPTHLPSLEASAPHWHDAGNWEKARDTLRTILRLRGGSGDAAQLNHLYLRLGQAELKVGDVTNAQKRFKKIIDQSPNHVDAMIGLAEIHRLTEDWNSLLSTYNSIIKYAKDPDQVIHAYMIKGDVLEQKLQFTDKAVLHYEKVLMYDKSNVDAMTRLGQIALRKADAPRARDLAERAVLAARGPEDRALGLLLGQLSEATGEVSAATIVSNVQRAGDVDGDVLAAFSRSAGEGPLSAERAAVAYRDALRPV